MYVCKWMHTYVHTQRRPAMYKFMLSMKDPVTKGIRMHKDGEIDTRSIYTCLAVARILNILTPGKYFSAFVY